MPRPVKNPHLDRSRGLQLQRQQWERVQSLSKQHPDLDMKPTEMLRRCLEVGICAAEDGAVHEVLVEGFKND
jgi:hypothetical protein